VPKVAGASISEALRIYIGDNRKNILKSLLAIMSRSNSYLRRKLYELKYLDDGHLTANEIRNKVGFEKFEKIIKFAFVRNPWDWEVSHYHYIMNTQRHLKHNLVGRLNSFDEFVEYGMEKTSEKNIFKKMLCNPEGELIVDYVGRFESLENDLKIICEKIGIESIKIFHKNKSNHKDYKSYYNNRTIELVGTHHDEDIKMFGYNFGNENLLPLL
jgi:hypothetical protein